MFTHTWRQYWGLKEDPFSCEDADKDLILTEVDPTAVHSGFDRIFGNPRVPAPGIVFGEKGSGKSGLRLMMRRRVNQYNQENPLEKVFLIEYIDFNFSIEQFRRALGLRGDSAQTVQEAVNRWKLSDHLDAILSLGITKLVDEVLDGKTKKDHLTRKQQMDLLILTSLYYFSDRRTVTEVLKRLITMYPALRFRPTSWWSIRIIPTLFFLFVAVLPFFARVDIGPANYWFAAGGIGLFLTWAWTLGIHTSILSQAKRAHASVKILPREAFPLVEVFSVLYAKERKEFVLPRGSDEAGRYHLLHRFLGLLECFQYKGIYVLLDRIDEPSLLSGKVDPMRQFVEKMLDIQFLQYPGLGIKLFLPIELDGVYRNASPEQLKRMRLDKSNLIPELKWSGQELYEIANQRMVACLLSEHRVNYMSDLFEDQFDFSYLRDTLTTLGTPRYAFGFLATLFTEFIKDLPNNLPENDPRWKISRAHFDIIRATWIDRSGVMRRVLN